MLFLDEFCKRKAMDARNNKTSSLFHFTREIDVLKSILKSGIVPNFCKEDLCYENRTLIIGVPMVSFCDIPLTRTSEFKSRYGEIAIGLSKDWAIKNQINPILYVNDIRVLVSLGFLNAYRHSQEEEVRKRGGDAKSITINLFSPESLKGVTHFVNMNNAKEAVYCLYGYVKKYIGKDRKGNDEINYIENEWRYVAAGDGIDWKWNEKDYKAWRGNGDKPKPSSELQNKKLKFTANDVTYIIVEKDNQISDMVDFILGLDAIGGDYDFLSDDAKKILLTKIISQEQIEKDF